MAGEGFERIAMFRRSSAVGLLVAALLGGGLFGCDRTQTRSSSPSPQIIAEEEPIEVIKGVSGSAEVGEYEVEVSDLYSVIEVYEDRAIAKFPIYNDFYSPNAITVNLPWIALGEAMTIVKGQRVEAKLEPGTAINLEIELTKDQYELAEQEGMLIGAYVVIEGEAQDVTF